MEVNVVKDLDPGAAEESIIRKSQGSEPLIISALRPEFRLGSLYDRRRDCLVPSVSLWKEETLKKHVSERPTPNQQWAIDSENTISSKVKKLDIEANLSLSLFGGMVDIKGHAEYLKDETQSSNVAKVSLTYRETTDYQELTQEAIKNLDYRDVLTDKNIKFTHVVVGIQYGGTCTMVFERTVKKHEEKEKVAGSLSVVLKAIPVSGDAKLDLDEEVKKNTDNFTCKVYSDIKLNQSVVSWDEAVALYKLLPTKLSSNVTSGCNDKSGCARGVPVKVWLLPKQLFGSTEDSFVKEISEGLSALPLRIIESLNNSINDSNDLFNKAKKFQVLQNKMKRFRTAVGAYLITFKKDTLSALLLKIRGGIEKEDALFKAVEAHNKTPFGSISLEAWLSLVEEEMCILNGYEEVLSATNIEFPSNHKINNEIIKHDVCVVLKLSMLRKKDEFLEKLERFLIDKSCNIENVNENAGHWIKNTNLLGITRRRVHEFKTFAEANKHNDELIFLVNVVELEEGESANTCIEVHQKGVKIGKKHFIPPTEVRGFIVDTCSHSGACLRWEIPKEGGNHVTSYKIKVEALVDIDNSNESERQSTKPNEQEFHVSHETETYCLENLQCSTHYVVTIVARCLNEAGWSKATSVTMTTLPSNPPNDITGEVSKGNNIKLSWSKPNQVAENAVFEKYEIEYKSREGTWKKADGVDVLEKDFLELSYNEDYHFRIMAVYNLGSTLWSSEFILKTNQMAVPQLIKAVMKDDVVDLKWSSEVEGDNVYNLQYSLETDENWTIRRLKNVGRNDVNTEKHAEVKLECGRDDRYKFRVQVTNECGTSEWSDTLTACNSKMVDEFEDEFSDGDDVKNICDDSTIHFYNEEDIIQIGDIRWAIQKSSEILELDSLNSKPRNRKVAVHRFLQDITRMEYQTINRPIVWCNEDDDDEHKGEYHPMDLLYHIIAEMKTAVRRKLYQKLSFCKLAVPVIIPKRVPLYMNMSLRQVKLTWFNENREQVEGCSTQAPMAVVSLLRLGKQGKDSPSKSVLGNELLDFMVDPTLGSCGFFTRNSLASNNRRKYCKGLVEALWYQKHSKSFQNSFCLLNLRGDALNHEQTAKTLILNSDIVILVLDNDMFKDTRYKGLLKELKEEATKANVHVKFIVLFTEAAKDNVKTNRQIFEDNLVKSGEKVIWKKITSNYKELLMAVKDRLTKLLETCNPLKSLDERFKYEFKESEEDDVNKPIVEVSDAFLQTMGIIKDAKPDERKKVRQKLLPLQSTVKRCAEAQREVNRCLDLEKRRESNNMVIRVQQEQFKLIENGFPEEISKFLKHLFEAYHSSKQKELTYVRGIQDVLDEWCLKYLSQIRIDYTAAVKQLTELKENEIQNRKDNSDDAELRKAIKKAARSCDDHTKKLIDMSVGIENIMREVGQVYETLSRNDKNASLSSLHTKCLKKLPEVAASLLVQGVALEIMDGDGLSVPIEWISTVLNSLREPLKQHIGIEHEPRLFVITVVGTQSTGKSTLLNTMFGVQFPVSAGRCTRGAFLQVIPIDNQECTYDALFIIDTEGLSAPEYRDDTTHDNEIATFVLGISDLAIVNVRGELPTNIENFLQISTCAFMRMNMANIRPSCVFVHQNCDPTSKEKNLGGRRVFMQMMDEAVKVQAKLIKKEDRFQGFQDVITMSLEDDFFYFPQLLNGSPPMAPPNCEYSDACASLKDYIISKMVSKQNDVSRSLQTLGNISEKIRLVWNGVLEENFVLSLTNSAEIQVKYEIENELSKWKSTMETKLSQCVDIECNGISSFVKTNQKRNDYVGLLRKEYDSRVLAYKTKSSEIFSEKREVFITFLGEKEVNKTMYGKWQQRSIDMMEEEWVSFNKFSESRIEKCYKHHKEGHSWEIKLEESKLIVDKKARELANKLLENKEKETGEVSLDYTDEECEEEFERFWGNVKSDFANECAEESYNLTDVVTSFKMEIMSRFGKTPNFGKILKMFGVNLQIGFSMAWINKSLLQFKGKLFKIAKTLHLIDDSVWKDRVEDMLANTMLSLERYCLELETTDGLVQMKIQEESTSVFDCKTLVSMYITRSLETLEKVHLAMENDQCFDMTDAFKTMFCLYAAQIAVDSFNMAQCSFLKFVSIFGRIEKEKAGIKDLFVAILKKEGAISICSKQITNLLQKKAYQEAEKGMRTNAKDIVVRLVPLKEHVHGLVLMDILNIVSKESQTEDDKILLKTYFANPFKTFEYKISAIISNNKDLNKEVLFDLTFDSICKSIRDTLADMQVDEKEDFVTKICNRKEFVELGVGTSDFNNIEFPVEDDGISCAEKRAKKRIEDENSVIEKVIELLKDTKDTKDKFGAVNLSILTKEVILDVKNHLFRCQVKCPFCRAPCDRNHKDAVSGGNHSCSSHRPQGFGKFTNINTKKFVLDICSELVKSTDTFRNADTNEKWIKYTDYKSLGGRYSQWDIAGCTSEHLLYWQYLCYHLMSDIKIFFPKAEQCTVSQWSGISYTQALKVLERNFSIAGKTYLDASGRCLIGASQ